MLAEKGFELSEQQELIVDTVKKNNVDARIIARAGCGKTTTILYASQYAHGDIAFVAFNKKIADEIASKAPKNVKVQTFHSLGFSAIRSAYGQKVEVDQDKMYTILKTLTNDETKHYITPARKLISLVKNLLCDPTEDKTLAELAMTYDVEDACSTVYALVRSGLALTFPVPGEPIVVDFDDMIYIPVKMGLKVHEYDTIFVDEAQDINSSQMLLILKALKPTGHIYFVGDPAQAIYGFRGADSKAMFTLSEKLETCGRKVIELPLTKTRRCPKQIVALAKQYVPDFECFPDAPEGNVSNIDIEYFRPKPGDIVLCRENAPIVNIAYMCIRNRIPVVILGRDQGQTIYNLVKKLNAKSIDDLVERAIAFREKEADKIKKDYCDKPTKMNNAIYNLDDKIKTIKFLCENEKTIDSLLESITKLFADNKSEESFVTCSSIHRAKGLGYKTVYYIITKDIKGEQEDNVKYVGITRSAKNLIFVDMHLVDD